MEKLSKRTIIAIDGGAGVGKTTVSKRVAEKLGILYIDTGAMYRAAGLYFLQNNIEITEENVNKYLDKIDVDLRVSFGQNLVYLNGVDVTDDIRSEEVSMAASDVSKYIPVRRMLVEKQRKIAGEQSVVIEGRDTTTVVFPNADIKIYLTASIDIRAKRRYDDRVKKGEVVDIKKVKADMQKRDVQDSTREDSPLTKTEDAIEIDTSNNTVEDTANYIIDIVKGRIGVESLD